MKCPICNQGELKRRKTEEIMFGTSLGLFDKLVCGHCGESFADEETQAKIEEAAKKKGIWGLGHKTTFAKIGNSVSVRIPKDIVRYLAIKEGQDAFIHPEGNTIIIEAR